MPVCLRGDGSSWREKEGLGDPLDLRRPSRKLADWRPKLGG